MRDPLEPRVLIVDDMPDNVRLLEHILREAGYSVALAGSGEEALECARQAPPTLALLDMMMPVMDGVELCGRLHQLPGLADLPVIFVTGLADRDIVVRAFESGAVDYITKPFVVEELLARVKTHVELKRSRDRLAAMVREREDVTHVVAHDIKNPLTCVLFGAHALKRAREPARVMELAEEVKTCAEEALRLITRFLARGAEGQRLRQFARQSVDLAPLVQQAFQFQRNSAVARSVKLSLRGDAQIHADATATRNVLQNLIANAIRYSPEGEEILVDMGPGRAGFSQCLVMDRGPGVAPADQDKLFQRFARIATAARQDEYSSGLGLAIAKHDISAMGGHLWYESRPAGGSVFGFELPATAELPTATS